MDEQGRRFLRQIGDLDPDRLAITAELADPVTGRLAPVDGVDEKLRASLIEAAETNLLRYVGVAKGQEVPHPLSQADALPLRVLAAENLFVLIEELWREDGPVASVLEQVRASNETLELMGKPVPLLPEDDPSRQIFQPLPLLVEFSPEQIRRQEESIIRSPSAAEMAAIQPIRIDERRIREFLAKAIPGEGKPMPPPAAPPGASLGWTEELFPQSYAFESRTISIDGLFDRKGARPGAPRAVLLGQPGGGKSTILRYLAYQFARRKLQFRGRPVVPLLIRLARWCQFASAVQDNHLPRFLADHYPGTAAAWWQARLERGDLLLLFDGLDEVHDPDDRFVTAGLKATLTRYKSCPTAVTCRTLAFYHPSYRTLLHGLPVYHLAPLSKAQIRRYASGYARLTDREPGPLTLRVESMLGVPRLGELAGNPLLLSVICFVLAVRSEDAPPVAIRVELFDDAVNQILKRSRDIADPLPSSLLDLRRRVLEFVSLELFKRQTGQEKALLLDQEVVIDAFSVGAARAGVEPEQGPRFLGDIVGRGLLQEEERPDGRKVYSYLHLQFQEYLACCSLTVEADFVDRVFDRLASPRWREVILLAIGQLALAADRDPLAFAATVEALLDFPDPFGSFLPRATLLLVTALPDLNQLPPEVIDRLAGSLLNAYADRERIDDFPDLASQIERAFVRLAAFEHGQRVLPMLLERLERIGENPAPALAAARLIRSARLYNGHTLEALITAFSSDDAAWGWPIDAALRDVAAAEDDWATARLDELIPFRKLRESDEDWERLCSDPLWLWTAVALLGGSDPGHRDRLQEARDRVARARRAEQEANNRPGTPPDQDERQRLTDAISAAESAVNALAKEGHQLSPRFFHRPSPLAGWLWDLFQTGTSAINVIESLARRLDATPDSLEATDALLVLTAVLPTPTLCEAVGDPGRLAVALTRLEPILDDAVESAYLEAFGDDLGQHEATAEFDDDRWGRLLGAASRVTARYTRKHALTLRLSGRAGSPQGRARRLAEFWQRSVVGGLDSDDVVYNWCVVLDTVGSVLARTPNLLAASLASAHTAGNARPGLPYGWPIDPLAPDVSEKGPTALLGSALDALAALPDVYDFVRGWALTQLAPTLRDAEMADEAQLLTLLTVSDRFNARADALRGLLGEDAGGYHDRFSAGGRQLVLTLRSGSPDPYVAARFALALESFASLGPDRGRADTVAGRIGDPTLRAWVLERLAVQADDDARRARLLEGAREAAEAIPWDDRDNRTRAAIRLAAWDPEQFDGRLAGHLRAMDKALARLDSTRPELRVGALSTLREFVRGRPALAPLFDEAVARLPDEERLAAQGFAGVAVQGVLRMMPAPMVILGVAAVAHDLRQLTGLSDDPDGVWIALTTDRANAALARLAEMARPGGLRLTRAAALALTRLCEAESWDIVRTVLPWVRKPDTVARPLLDRLARHDDRVIRDQATLLGAELVGLDERTIPALVALLRSGDYYTRSRAALTLYGDRSERTPPLIASRLDRPALETIMRAMLDEKTNDIRVRLSLAWTLERVIFDDPDLIRNWAARLPDGTEPRVSAGLLGSLSQVSRAGWLEQLRVLAGGSPQARRAVLRSICSQAHLDRIGDERWAQLLPFLEALDIDADGGDAYVLDGPARLVDAAAAAWDGFGGKLPGPTSVSEAARRNFLDSRETVADALRLRPEASLRQRLGEIGGLRFVGKHHTRRFSAAAARIEERPEWIRVFVDWLSEALVRPADDLEREGHYVFMRGDLLGVVAEAAERLPGEFRAAAARRPVLVRLLAKAARQQNTFPGRQAALRLLALLGKVTAEVVEAFRSTLGDTATVQATAAATLGRYREIDEGFVADILRRLEVEPCPTTRYVAVRLLAGVARNVFLRAGIRDRIVEGFRLALLRLREDTCQDVYMLTERLIGNDNSLYQLDHLGRLDRLIYQELVDLSGVGLDPTVTLSVRGEGE